MSAQVWPVSFEVGFIAPDGISGPGRLEVEPGAIRCVPMFFLGRERANRTWTPHRPVGEFCVAGKAERGQGVAAGQPKAPPGASVGIGDLADVAGSA